jgi:Rrf2 family protein
MKLQKNTSLALYSVLEFASDPTRHISAAEIADKHGASPHHLAKVLAELARNGIVESVRGAGGGYRFVGNARRLTLMDVIEQFEDVSPPIAGRGAAERSTPVEQALGAVLSEIDQNAAATFRSITLATMLRMIERQRSAAVGGAARRRSSKT